MHVSQLDVNRVNKVEDICKVGDLITVKVTEIDAQNRINLSRKEALRFRVLLQVHPILCNNQRRILESLDPSRVWRVFARIGHDNAEAAWKQ